MKFEKELYTPQVDQSDCGCAALSMIFKTYGTNLTLETIRNLSGTTQEGTSALGIKKTAQKFGFNVSAIKADNTLFEQLTDDSFPFIAHVIKNNSYPHYYVVFGIKENYILIADPDPSEKIKKIKIEDFLVEWTGVCLFFSTTSKYKKVVHQKKGLLSFIPLLKNEKKIIASIFITSLLVTIISIIGAYYLQNIIDNILPNLLLNQLQIISLGLIIVYIFQQVLSFSQSILLSLFAQRLSKKIILSYIKHVFNLPISFFSTRKTGEITSRFNDANSIIDALASAVITILLDLGIVIIMGTVLVIENTKLFFLALISVPVYAIIIIFFIPIFEKKNRKAMQANSILSSSIIEDINGMETIKSMVSESKRYDKIVQEFENYLSAELQLQKVDSLQVALKSVIQLIMGVLILWYGTLLIFQNNMTLGQLVTFNALLVYFITPLTNIINLQSKIQSAKVANERMNEVFMVNSEFENKEKEVDIINTDIKIKNLFYNYDYKTNVLSNVNFTIKSKEKIAIMGLSGSGKSTLAKILANFIQPVSGEITLGEININTIDKRQLRKIITYVPQNPYIFTGTILDNLTLGLQEDLDYNKINEALEISEIKSDIEDMQLGLMTELSTDGTNISGGQKQRIALARALISSGDILILDESTSNLDIVTENKIINNLIKIDKTIIFVAHRESVAKKCEKVLFIKNGKLTKMSNN